MAEQKQRFIKTTVEVGSDGVVLLETVNRGQARNGKSFCQRMSATCSGNEKTVAVPGEAKRFIEGVCGAAATTRQTQRVADVHAFPGHIACDSASRSELVMPLALEGALIGVFDLDSPVPGRFDVDDQAGLETIAALFVSTLRANP